MLDSTIVDVAIGVVFVFMVVSIVASGINELVAGMLRWRSKELQKGLQALLGAPGEEPTTDDSSLYGKLVKNPLIRDLSKPSWLSRAARTTRGPSYIPTSTFGRALLDEVFPEADDTTTLTEMRLWLEDSDDHAYVSFIPKEVRQSLLSIMKDAEGEVKKFRAGVEAWYDSLMDRVSGWYGRKARWWLVVWGLLLAIALNIDIVAITNSLWTDDTVRAAVVTAAATRLESDPTDTTAGAEGAGRGDAGADADDAGAEENEATTTTVATSGGDTSQVSLSAKQIEEELDKLAQLDLPIGWASSGDESRLPKGSWGWPVRILSWAIIAAAASFGAPFWFDLLGKVSNLRMAGKKPESKPEES